MNPTREELIHALRRIKGTALNFTDGPAALAHIIRICIDVGIAEHIETLPEE
jgi:hypothetical protein